MQCVCLVFGVCLFAVSALWSVCGQRYVSVSGVCTVECVFVVSDVPV